MAKNTETAVVVSDFEPRTVAIGDYDPKRFNMLIRGKTLLQTNPFLRPVVREILLDQPGDTYPITQRKDGNDWVATEVGISAVGLFVLSDNGGVVDVPQASGRVDDGRDPGVCTYRATIAMRMPDGEWTFRTRECTVKLATLEKEIRAQKTSKATQYKWDAKKLEAEIAKELLLKEKFMERLAETGAKTRAIRAIFGIRTKYTPAEMARPFVFAAVVQDMSQPDLRARMLDQATSAIGAVFGPVSGASGAAPRLLNAGPAVEDLDEAAAEPEPDEPTGELSSAEAGATAAVARDATPAGEEPSWLHAAPPVVATAAAAQPAPIDLAAKLRESVESSGLNGPATEVQTGRIREILEPLGDRQAVGAGLVAVWPEEGPNNRPAVFDGLTAAQAQAIINLADSFAMADRDFLAAWREMAGKAAAA